MLAAAGLGVRGDCNYGEYAWRGGIRCAQRVVVGMWFDVYDWSDGFWHRGEHSSG